MANKEYTKCKTQDKNIHAFEGIKTLCGTRKTFTMEFSKEIENLEVTCKKCKRQLKIKTQLESETVKNKESTEIEN